MFWMVQSWEAAFYQWILCPEISLSWILGCVIIGVQHERSLKFYPASGTFAQLQLREVFGIRTISLSLSINKFTTNHYSIEPIHSEFITQLIYPKRNSLTRMRERERVPQGWLWWKFSEDDGKNHMCSFNKYRPIACWIVDTWDSYCNHLRILIRLDTIEFKSTLIINFMGKCKGWQ